MIFRRIRVIGTVLALVAALAVLALAAGIAANRPPLTRPPGVLARLTLYLGSNVAETGPDARLPELAPIVLEGGLAAPAQAVADACRELGWRAVTIHEGGSVVTAQVVTPVLRFTDDVQVHLLARADGTLEARVRSASRVGKGDLGANARHVMDLRAALERAGLLARHGS